MKARLINAGSLDTVIVFEGQEYGYNYANSDFAGTYDEFVEQCKQDTEDNPCYY